VYLQDAAAGLLEVGHLLTEGECDLKGLLTAGQVLAGEGPVEDRHGARQHALDEAARDGLSQTHTQETEGGETAARPMQTYGGVSSYYSFFLFIKF
jgi:hypothetical protein